MEYFKQLFKNVAGVARVMSPSQAMMLIAVVAGVIVGAVVIAGWVKNIDYSVLYSNLEPAEAGEVVAQLAEQKIPYELTAGGTTISIPSGDVYRVRISLASQGLPRSGNIGYAIFDKSNLGMTEFLQNLNYRRALEGELMKTIMQLADVQAARVHIVMPKDRLFKEDKQEATASVVLKLKHRGGLSKAQLSGITHLVASSVEGLKPQNISIIDYNGELLSSRLQGDPLAGLSSSQLEVRQNVEHYLEDKAQSLLDGVIGMGKSFVRVNAELDFQQVEKTNEVYDPNSAVVRSEEKTEETKTASDKQEPNAETRDDNRVETSITNYEINKSVEHIINAIGNIKRLSVAVMLDGQYKPMENAEGVMEQVYEPRPQEEIDRITAIVRNAVGYDTQRNDQIEVVNLPFDRTAIEVEQEKLDKIVQRDFYFDIGKKVLLVALAVLGLLIVRRILKKTLASIKGILPPAPGPRAPRAPMPGYPPSAADEEEVPPIVPESRRPRLIDQMQVAAKGRPEEIAKVIKTMMIE